MRMPQACLTGLACADDGQHGQLKQRLAPQRPEHQRRVRQGVEHGWPLGVRGGEQMIALCRRMPGKVCHHLLMERRGFGALAPQAQRCRETWRQYRQPALRPVGPLTQLGRGMRAKARQARQKDEIRPRGAALFDIDRHATPPERIIDSPWLFTSARRVVSPRRCLRMTGAFDQPWGSSSLSPTLNGRPACITSA